MAILGCLAAIAACMLMMGLSFRFGTVNQTVENSDTRDASREDNRRDAARRAA
ncbi:MAG: hypothetical protein ACK5TX_16030 [Planctomyces sp.]